MSQHDPAAFEQLYGEHASQVRNFLRFCTRDHAAADDLMQETFLQIWRRPDAFDPQRSGIRAYLLGIARKKAADWWRRNKTEAAQPTRAATIRSEFQLEFADALETLAPDLRIALWLREIEGYSYAELADILEIPLGTVRSRLFAAREQLRLIWNSQKEKTK
jgi:RNA polymerase sigma-70 factor, ECF subfamily